LNSTRHLFVSERAWSQLANHFALALSERDSAEMSSVQLSIAAWRLSLSEFDSNMQAREDDVKHQLTFVLNEIQKRLETDGQYGITLFFFYWQL